MILLASNTLMSAPEIARCCSTDESHVRKVIHDFNERGFESLRPRFRGGRPRRISIDESSGSSRSPAPVPTRSGCLHALEPGQASRLSGRAGASSVSPAHLGRILPATGSRCSARAAGSRAPIPTTRRRPRGCSRSTGSSPEDGVVISFDEKGPESLRPARPRLGRRGRPERHRATYNRRQGIRYLVGALDVHADYLRITAPAARNGASTLAFMQQIRLAYPKPDPPLLDPGRPLQPLDAGDPRLGGAPTTSSSSRPRPTPATSTGSRATFGAIDEFVCKNADYLDWDAFGYALARHVRYRNSAHRDGRLIALERRRQIAA